MRTVYAVVDNESMLPQMGKAVCGSIASILMRMVRETG